MPAKKFTGFKLKIHIPQSQTLQQRFGHNNNSSLRKENDTKTKSNSDTELYKLNNKPSKKVIQNKTAKKI